MNRYEIAIKELDERYNTEATEAEVDAVLAGLDETGQAWIDTATETEIAEYVVGVLCNTLPARNEDWS